jgi:hypothetical protein
VTQRWRARLYEETSTEERVNVADEGRLTRRDRSPGHIVPGPDDVVATDSNAGARASSWRLPLLQRRHHVRAQTANQALSCNLLTSRGLWRMAEDPEVQLLLLRSSLAAELAGSARPRRRVCRGGGAVAPALEGPLPGLGPQRLESLRSLSEPLPRHCPPPKSEPATGSAPDPAVGPTAQLLSAD